MQEDLAAREARYGANRVRQPGEVSLLALVWEAAQDFTILVLLCAGAASLALELAISGKVGCCHWPARIARVALG